MVKTLNKLGRENTPFFFFINYDKTDYIIEPLDNLQNIEFAFEEENPTNEKITLKKFPIDLNEYEKKFNTLQKEITKGNTYLANLTCKTEIKTNKSLDEIYRNSHGKYRVLYKDKFALFSPETFIEIFNNKIYTYPMKGTIDANLPNAKTQILEDEKELAEHVMVTDLLRNDLGIVANNIRVEKFRFIEKINAGEKELLQVSSKITGDLQEDWNSYIGEILDKLLPAGSVTGTPKRKTVEILKEIEGFERDFFTGVFGIYKDRTLQSGVAIRFIEKEGDKLFFKSGGGITESSEVLKEYQEMKDKIYVPTL